MAYSVHNFNFITALVSGPYMQPHALMKLSRVNQQGFTLLEIIAVLVILSILAVVAVPRYFDLQAQAREKALDGVQAEVIGRVNLHFARQILEGQAPNQIDYRTGAIGDNLGPDFRLTTDDTAGPGTENFVITITAISGALNGLTRTVQIVRPGWP